MADMHWDRTTIRAKLFFLLLLIGITPIALMGTMTYFRSIGYLEEAAHNQLKSIRETKKHQIENYFSRIEDQIITISEDLMTVEAMMAFTQGYEFLGASPPSAFDENRETYETNLKNFYQQQAASTPGAPEGSAARWYPPSPASRILQCLYITENPKPEGEKQALDRADDDSLYSHHHERFHPLLRNYSNRFGFHDLLLIEPDGSIVYSVAKEFDFATNLETGPYRETNLARAFQQAKLAQEPEGVVVVDFEHFEPSHNIPAAFVASPIYNEDQLVGVAVFQLSIWEINNMVTVMGQWEEIGLGKTGQLLLVASDRTLRNDDRQLSENKEAYLKKLKRGGMDDATLEMVDQTDTTILLQMLDEEFERAAASGTTGEGEYRSGLREDLLAAYAPLYIQGLDWSIVAIMGRNEAFQLANKIGRGILVNFGIVLLIVFLFGAPIIRSISHSIKLVSRELEDLASGEADLTRRIPEKCTGEMGLLACSFNTLMDNLSQMVKQVQRVGIQVTSSTTQIAASARQLESTVAEQASSTNQVVATAKEISATSRELLSTMEDVAELGGKNLELVQTGRYGLDEIDGTMHRLVESTSSFSSKLGAINDKANNINSIITTITKVADQTNLLSLNAAIEAEKAGEYGQGFSVVAREIRRLADQTAVATLDIEKMVREMLSAVSTGVMEMDRFSKEVEKAVEDIRVNGEQLSEIIQNQEAIAPQFQSVTEGMNLQSQGALQITQAMVQLSEGAEQTANSLREFNNATTQLNEAAQRLQKEFSRFRVLDS
ncbi:MAG: methyl-accepting chemotaxis protein [Candidatus Hinthialibacter antarcticus]|nr:methyl-accepting chemotaxis protein [Candidatus Hinthialibacter antarcticus]